MAICLPSRKLSKLEEQHAWHCWRSRDELISGVLQWTPTYARAMQDDQLENIYSSYVRIRDIVLKTCQRLWTIRRSGDRGSGICMLAARHDDDDDHDDEGLYAFKITKQNRKSPSTWEIVLSEFKFQSCYNIHFRTNTLAKGMYHLIPHSNGLNCTTAVLFKDGFGIK